MVDCGAKPADRAVPERLADVQAGQIGTPLENVDTYLNNVETSVDVNAITESVTKLRRASS